MLDGTLFFVKSARYGKPDKDFVRLFISIPVHFTTSRQPSKNSLLGTSRAYFYSHEKNTHFIDKKRYFHHI